MIMCGINGIYKKQSSAEEIKEKLEAMNKDIIHRGPDDDGFFVHPSIGMSMRRLSVIDLKTGKQPIYSDDQQLVIVFNGEIYNYKKYRDLLIKKGYLFKTTSDTEVILKLYEEYDTDAFGMLDGMFAFSIYDLRKNMLFIARDFFGEKPLYWYQDSEQLLWASELKSIKNNVKKTFSFSKEGLNLYFRLTYIPAPYSIYQEVRKLEANHFLSFNVENQEISIQVIKRKDAFADFTAEDYKAEVARTHNLVMESVQSRAVSDVAIGTFLSGGVDSSVVSLALAQQSTNKINTFSIGFEKKSFDETDKSRLVAKLINSHHHEFILKPADLQDHFHQILLNFDEPFADSSALPSYLVASKTKEHVTVALTGDGGDEVFGGYNKYLIGKINSRYSSIIPKKAHETIKSFGNKLLSTPNDKRGKRFKLKKLINAVDYGDDFYYNMISLAFSEEESQLLLLDDFLQKEIFENYKAKVQGHSNLTDFRNIDLVLSLEGDMLPKVDRTSMLASLESRAPFLNKKLWDYTQRLPENYLINGWNKKRILKDAFRKYFPAGFLDKSKKGFGVPVGDWLRGHLKDELLSFIDQKFLEHQQIFNIPFIQNLVLQHVHAKQDNTFKVWTYYCFQKWYLTID